MRLAVIRAKYPTFIDIVYELAQMIDGLLSEQASLPPMECSCCGCDDDHACAIGCRWVGPFLCSSCSDRGRAAYLTATGRIAA